jgi:hypothetical protein
MMRVMLKDVGDTHIRAWAFRHGVLCPESGRIPNNVRSAFDKARLAAVEKFDADWLTSTNHGSEFI